MTLAPIQALRGLAALAIAIFHGLHEAGLYAAATGRPPLLPIAASWQSGVDVFFVISGFVMVLASRGLFGRADARRTFLARRVARVVPLYWIVTSGYLALAIAAPPLLNAAVLSPAFVAASYLFVPVARPDGLVQPLYSLGWTLNYEMLFYGLFALALGLSRRTAVIMVILALGALVGLGRLAAWPQPMSFWTDPILLEFGAGVALGLLRTEGVLLGRLARLALTVAGAALLIAVAGHGELSGFPRVLGWGVPAACFVAACGLGQDDPWREEGWAARLGATLGDVSYALYLLHPFAFRGTRELVRAAGLAPVLDPWTFLMLGLVAAVLAAYGAFHLVERPLTLRLRRLLEPAPRP